MEITILSAQGLKKTSSSSFFSHQMKPFITFTTTLPPSVSDGAKQCRHVYKTRVDDEGGPNPTWDDKFKLPNVDANFLHKKCSCIYLQVYTKSLIGGNSLLGWCRILLSDVLDGLTPVGAVRRLSYRLQKKDGSRGHGVVNVAVKVERHLFPLVQPPTGSLLPEMGSGYTVIGFPVGVVQYAGCKM